jgi:predicted regulator of Ras-like GTPase activity (Roadblock/LC7/MglB family)
MTIADILKALRDVDGVYGSYIVSNTGMLVNRDFPNALSNYSMNLAGVKLCRLWESVSDTQVNYINLNFKYHRIHIRKFVHGSIFIYIPPKVNMLTLSGASQIAINALNLMPGEYFEKRLPDTNTRNSDQKMVIYRGIRYEV